ncbi:uncharacterized protein LOC111308917 [Durio zibethinus]|uniref:Uncharacterized protein LOC111308917 n=1 Tax=Durio zibethinus TaxID=66656 RepID=A0A6P6AER4_DURZI|nr:uncharacterized protein LOC111308917 [Durio zibethinus]
MGFTYGHGLVLVMAAAASMLEVSIANKDWGFKSNNTGWVWSSNNRPLHETEGTNKIIVGGSENWQFGFNYSEWAFQNAPFYFNDALGELTISFLSIFFTQNEKRKRKAYYIFVQIN